MKYQKKSAKTITSDEMIEIKPKIHNINELYNSETNSFEIGGCLWKLLSIQSNSKK